MAGSNKLVWLIAAFHCIGALQFGFNTAITSPAMGAISKHFDFATTEDSSGSGSHGGDAAMKSIVVSAILIGCLVSALFTGTISDRFGRFPLLFVMNGLFIVGAIICTASVHVGMLIAGRLVLGLGVGMASVVVPLIIGEIAPPSIRGRIGTLNQLGVTIGILLAYIVGTIFSQIHSDNLSWRLSLAVSIVLAVIHIVVCTFAHKESPRWLVMKGRIDEARETLKFFRRTDDVEDELAELQKASAGEAAPSLLEQVRMIRKPARLLVIVVGVMFLQQITGINAILYYLSTFLESCGMSSDMAGYMSIVIAVIQVGMTLVSVVLVDKLGRKPLLSISFAGMCCSAMLIGAFSHISGNQLSKNSAATGSVIFTILFIVFFSIGTGPVPWALVPEVFPVKTRALAVSISVFTNWVTNLGVSLAFLSLVDATSMAAVFWGFAVLSAAGVLFVQFVIPETKGRKVEDIVATMENTGFVLKPIPLPTLGSPAEVKKGSSDDLKTSSDSLKTSSDSSTSV